ncbi:hypothetical protein V8F06_011594 [Rhypophila decipiens]
MDQVDHSNGGDTNGNRHDRPVIVDGGSRSPSSWTAFRTGMPASQAGPSTSSNHQPRAHHQAPPSHPHAAATFPIDGIRRPEKPFLPPPPGTTPEHVLHIPLSYQTPQARAAGLAKLNRKEEEIPVNPVKAQRQNGTKNKGKQKLVDQAKGGGDKDDPEDENDSLLARFRQRRTSLRNRTSSYPGIPRPLDLGDQSGLTNDEEEEDEDDEIDPQVAQHLAPLQLRFQTQPFHLPNPQPLLGLGLMLLLLAKSK